MFTHNVMPGDETGLDELIRWLQANRDAGRTKVRLGLPGEYNTRVALRGDLESDVTGKLDTVYLYEI